MQKTKAQNTNFAFGQPLAKNFSINQGMPSNEVYRTLQDNLGFIWFCTDRGLVRFNGLEYELFDKTNGLPSNVILEGKKDSIGRLWFLSLEDEIFYYQNGFSPLNLSELLSKQDLNISQIKIRDFYNDSHDTLHILSSKPWEKTYYLKIYEQKIVKIHTLSDTNYSVYYKKFGKGRVLSCINYCYSFTEKNHQKQKKCGLTALAFTQHNKHIDPKNNLLNIYRHNMLANGEHIYYNLENAIYSISKNKHQRIINQVPNVTIEFELFKKHGFIATSAGLLETDSLFNPIKSYFQTSFITSIFCDKDSNFWVSSLNKGVFLVPNLAFKVLALDNQSHQTNVSFSQIENNYYIGRHDGKLCIVNSKTGQTDTCLQILKKGIPIDGITPLNQNEIILTSTGSPIKYNINTGFKETITIGTISNIFCRWSTDTIIGLRYTNGVLGMYNNNLNSLYKSLDQPQQISDYNIKSFCLYAEKNKKRLLIGSIKGVYNFYPQQKCFEKSTEFSDIQTQSISCIDQRNNIYAFGTKGSGIYIKTPLTAFWLNKTQNLRDLNINCLLFLNDTTLFFGTNSHLGIIKINYKNINKSVLRFYDKNNGLLGNQIKKIILKNSKTVQILTDRGLLSLREDNFEKTQPSILHFNGFNINGIQFLDDSISLKYEQNNILASFTAINFLAGNNLQYAYKIKPIQTNWVYTKEPSINLSGLRPGNYQVDFVVHDINNSTENPKVYNLSLLIKTPFYFTATFIIFIISLIVGSSLFLSHLVVKRIRKNAQMQTQLIELEHLALRSQMNPHFFFNTLNSIQSFIATNDKRNAYDYIAKFAKLVRNFLEQTNAKSTKLDAEIDGIKSYIELEQLRFNNNFSYNIIIDSELENQLSSLIIPAMILQPIVENAILHGLRPKEKEGALSISITEANNYLEISISDNGVGRKKANELNIKKGKIHHSMGLENIKRRIELLNRKHSFTIEMTIQDLYKNHTQYPGTQVTLKFPIHGYD